MKKILISLVLVFSVFLIPIQVLGQEVNTTQVQIEILQKLIEVYQKLIEELLKGQEVTDIQPEQIINDSNNYPITGNNEIQESIIEPFNFTVITYNNKVSLTVVIPETFDKCVLVIKDKNEKIWRDSSIWFKGKDNENRQVIDVDLDNEYNYNITCEKQGYQNSTKIGSF